MQERWGILLKNYNQQQYKAGDEGAQRDGDRPLVRYGIQLE